jgi:hypothetical protein
VHNTMSSSKWKQALKGKKHGHTCPPEIKVSE